MIKMINKLGIEGIYLNIIMVAYDKPTANIILSGEKSKPLPLRSRTKQECPLARAIRQEKEIKSMRSGKEEIKMSIQNSKDSTKKLLDLMNKFSKVPRYKSNSRVSIH